MTAAAVAAVIGLAVLTRRDRWTSLSVVAVLLVIVFRQGHVAQRPARMEEFRQGKDRR